MTIHIVENSVYYIYPSSVMVLLRNYIDEKLMGYCNENEQKYELDQ